MSSALIWQLTKNHHSFLIKRGQTNRTGAVKFSAERGNVLNINTYKYSGIVNASTIDISSDLKLTTKDVKAANKPSKSFVTVPLTLNTGKSSKKVAETAASCRPDLKSAATLRYKKLARATSIKRGYSKKVVKSTRRGVKL